MFTLQILQAALASNIRIAQRGRRAESLADGFARTDHQHDDRECIGEHLQEETKIWVVIKRIVKSK